MTYQFASHNLGLYVTLSGYNDKLDVLAKVVLEKARDLIVTPERLHVVKASVSIMFCIDLNISDMNSRLSGTGETSS